MTTGPQVAHEIAVDNEDVEAFLRDGPTGVSEEDTAEAQRAGSPLLDRSLEIADQIQTQTEGGLSRDFGAWIFGAEIGILVARRLFRHSTGRGGAPRQAYVIWRAVLNRARGHPLFCDDISQLKQAHLAFDDCSFDETCRLRDLADQPVVGRA
jgi:hypothetical protein